MDSMKIIAREMRAELLNPEIEKNIFVPWVFG
jgi:hypothetical protein